MMRSRGDLRVASVPRRLLAGLIDAVLVLAAVALAVGAYSAGTVLLGKQRALGLGRLPKLMQSSRVRIVLSASAFVADVLSTGRRGPGSRIAGIRLVDARTGGRVGLWQATVRVTARRAWPPLVRRLTSRLKTADQCKHQEMLSNFEALKREHGDDHEALHRALTDMHREQHIRPYVACLPALIQLVLSAAIEGPALWSPLHQGLPDRLAGTIVVRNPS